MDVATNGLPESQPQAEVSKVDGSCRDGCDGDEDGDNPVLPPELQQRIFTTAFYDDEEMKDPCRLLLVAKKTFEWLAPQVYKIVILHATITWPPMSLSTDKLLRYGKYVRHLLLEYGNQEHAMDYLQACPNVVNLAMVCLSSSPFEADHLDTLASLPLKELSIDIRRIPISPRISQFFNNITHADLAYLPNWNELPLDTLSQFTSLTHLMMMGDNNTDDQVNRILECIPHLKVLLIVYYVRRYGKILEGYVYEEDNEDDLEPSDPRVVVISCTFVWHWRDAARGWENPWSWADELLEERRIAQAEGKMLT